MLAFARVAGETAPLLFTAFRKHFLEPALRPADRGSPFADLRLCELTYEDWNRQAWAGSFVLLVLIVGAVAAVRYVVRHGSFAAGAR
jgi:phosphate transport system permease protein